MESLTESQQQYAAAVPGLVRRLAAPHIAASAGLMVPLEFRPDVYPGQDPMEFLVEGNPQPKEATDVAAHVAEKNFIPARDALGARDGTAEVMGEAREHLEAGGNLALITRHDNLTDIAYWLKMGLDFLHDQDYEPRVRAIVVGEMLSGIGHMFTFEGASEPQEVPAMTTLQILCSHIYKSWPWTESMKAEIDKLPNPEVIGAEMSRRNKAMNASLNDELDEGEVIIGLAPTGTTKVIKTVSGAVKLPPLKDGTVRMMSHPKLLALPIIIEYKGGAPFAYILGGLVNIKDAKGANAVMDMLAAADTKGIEDASDAELFRRFGGVALG